MNLLHIEVLSRQYINIFSILDTIIHTVTLLYYNISCLIINFAQLRIREQIDNRPAETAHKKTLRHFVQNVSAFGVKRRSVPAGSKNKVPKKDIKNKTESSGIVEIIIPLENDN